MNSYSQLQSLWGQRGAFLFDAEKPSRLAVMAKEKKLKRKKRVLFAASIFSLMGFFFAWFIAFTTFTPAFISGVSLPLFLAIILSLVVLGFVFFMNHEFTAATLNDNHASLKSLSQVSETTKTKVLFSLKRCLDYAKNEEEISLFKEMEDISLYEESFGENLARLLSCVARENQESLVKEYAQQSREKNSSKEDMTNRVLVIETKELEEGIKESAHLKEALVW